MFLLIIIRNNQSKLIEPPTLELRDLVRSSAARMPAEATMDDTGDGRQSMVRVRVGAQFAVTEFPKFGIVHKIGR